MVGGQPTLAIALSVGCEQASTQVDRRPPVPAALREE